MKYAKAQANFSATISTHICLLLSSAMKLGPGLSLGSASASGHTPGNSHPCSGVGVSVKTLGYFLNMQLEPCGIGHSVNVCRGSGVKKSPGASPGVFSVGIRDTV